MELLFIFLIGLAVGSFLNCIIYRLSINEKPEGRSYCPKCKHLLSFSDLFPLFSYIFLLGKCRYCKEKISIQYPLVELSTGLLFLSFYFLPTNTFETVTLFYLLIVASLLVLIFVYDLKYYIIPDFAVFSLVGISFLYLIFHSFFEGSIDAFLSGLLSGIGSFLFFFSIFYFTKGKGMGFGDVKYVLFMGFFLGFPDIIVGLFLSFLFGAIIGIGLLISEKKELKSEIPFGPFLITGTILSYFFSDFMINWYLGLII